MCVRAVLDSLLNTFAVVAMTLLARSVYGCSPNIKAKVFTDDLMRVVSECISRMPSQALVGRAACILLCNLLAGCDPNVDKVCHFILGFVEFMFFRSCASFGTGHSFWDSSSTCSCVIERE